jgi:hypothetical protein
MGADMKLGSWAARISVVATVALLAGGLTALPAAADGALPSVSSSQNPSNACGSVTFTATVHGIPTIGGAVFFDGLSPIGAAPITPDFDPDPITGIHDIPTDHSSGSISVSLPGGTHVITAAVGTLSNFGGLSDPLVQTVNAATSATSVSSSVNPTVFGQSTTFTAAVTSACSGSVSGSVQFQVDGVNVGASQPLDGTGHASLSTSTLDAGLHSVTAVFTSNNSDVQGSSGSLASLVLPGQLVHPADTNTSVSSSNNPSEFGANVAFTGSTTVVAPGAGTPTGTTQFTDNGTPLGGPQGLDGSGNAGVSTTTLSVGSHTIGAAYSSNSPNFNGSSGSLTQQVNRARTTLTYNGDTTADFHDTAVLSATLTRTDNGAPIAGKNVTFSMGLEGCSQTTDASGKAACTIIPQEPASSPGVSADFVGDSDYLASSQSAPFVVTKEETTTVYTGPTVIAQGSPVALSGQLLEDGVTPIAGRVLTLKLGSGTGSQECTTAATDAAGNGSCTIASVSTAQGPEPVSASFAGDPFYLPSSDTSKQVIVFAFPSRGIFVLGDRSASGASTFWGAQWAKSNSLSGGGAPSAFKGFADSTQTTPPSCATTFSSSPGNSSSPVDSLPAYMGTAVTSQVTKHGNDIGGVITHIVVVVTDPGYAADPGHAGTGTVIATYC